MKEQLLKRLAMQFPNGVQPFQHRDVIRTYFMGFCDGLLAARQNKAIEQLLKQYPYINDDNWWPDASWTWWTNNTNGG